MKEPYGEGVVSHTGPESCGVSSNVNAEALTGVHAGQVLSREILLKFRVPTLWDVMEGNTERVVVLIFNPSISWNGFSIDTQSSFSYYLFSEKGVCILFLVAFSPLRDQEAFSQ